MTDAQPGQPAPPETLPLRLRTLGKRALGLRWVPITASLVSLILSLTAIFVSTQQPDVTLVLPDQVRIAQGRWQGAAFVYLQPAFVSTGRNERIEVVRDMTLRVQPPTGAPTDFAWTEQVRLVGDAASSGLSYEYAGDAVPLLVSPRSAAAPVCLFQAPQGFFFAPGTYAFTLSADRVVAGAPLAATFSATLSAADIAFLEEPNTQRFLALPIATP